MSPVSAGAEEEPPCALSGGGGAERKLGATPWRLTGVLVTIKMHTF